MPVLVARVFRAFIRTATKLSWIGTGPVRTPSQIIAAYVADTACKNVASQPTNGLPPPHSGECFFRFQEQLLNWVG